jgi:sulfopyruvate decarboxylase subunit beta
VRGPEEELIRILKKAGVNFTSSLPCEKIGCLIDMIDRSFFHVQLTREEEGVGISAGAALSGKRPAVFIQSSGVGNMINALLSLTHFYELPLAMFVSHRGLYKEKIEAQMPMGMRLPKILRGAGISVSVVSTPNDLRDVEERLDSVYRNNRIHAFLLSPRVWENSESEIPLSICRKSAIGDIELPKASFRPSPPRYTRYEILDMIAPLIDERAVVCNLGLPAKELYAIKHQPSNFYMLGSMGMASPIGLGISLTCDKEVIVIDGDGSLLMNLGVLGTIAHYRPHNLMIFAIDNGSYGSTGCQPTLTSSCVDLEAAARGLGIRNTVKVAGKRQIRDVVKNSVKGPLFVHVRALPGNKELQNIDLSHLENKRQFQDFLRSE